MCLHRTPYKSSCASGRLPGRQHFILWPLETGIAVFGRCFPNRCWLEKRRKTLSDTHRANWWLALLGCLVWDYIAQHFLYLCLCLSMGWRNIYNDRYDVWLFCPQLCLKSPLSNPKATSANLNRSFRNVPKRATSRSECTGVCHLCLAGRPGYEYEDLFLHNLLKTCFWVIVCGLLSTWSPWFIPINTSKLNSIGIIHH